MTGSQDASLGLQQQAQQEESAHAAAVREGAAQAQTACDLQIEQCRRGLADALQNFAAERRKYFLAVEHEVVQLALNIAARFCGVRLRSMRNFWPEWFAWPLIKPARPHRSQCGRTQSRFPLCYALLRARDGRKPAAGVAGTAL